MGLCGCIFHPPHCSKNMYLQAFLKVHKHCVPNQQVFVGRRTFPQRAHRVARAAAILPRFVRSYREKAGSRRRRWAREESQVDTRDAVRSRHAYVGGLAGFRPLPSQVLRCFSVPRFGIYIRESPHAGERRKERKRERETSKDATLQCLTPATVQYYFGTRPGPTRSFSP